MCGRFVSVGIAAGFAASFALAQPAPPPPPLPPEGATSKPAPSASEFELEPQVTIIRRENETREEVRVGGELRFIRVTPLHGRPYYLVPDQNGLQFIRRDSLDTSLKVPMWMILSW
jgi:hypothetical protein